MTLSPSNNKVYISNHGARGGDFFGEVKFGENYGWEIWCWGGQNYNLTKCGETQKWDNDLQKLLYMDTFNCCKAIKFIKVLNFLNGITTS